MATGKVHRDLQRRLDTLVGITASTRRALVHGDVSPKNILIGPRGPVFIDAECAWYGDPAFDAAFCLNHLLLKCLWRPRHAKAYLACFDRFAATYLGRVVGDRAGIETRIAHLLPALMLARMDGKSPIEYVTDERDKDRVRAIACPLMRVLATISRRSPRVGERGVGPMKGAGIVRVHGRSVWDSRGRPTVEAEVTLACGARGRAIAPAGASTGAARQSICATRRRGSAGPASRAQLAMSMARSPAPCMGATRERKPRSIAC